MENNYIMLLTLTGFSFQYEWLRTDRRRALLIGSCALGLNLLTRLTTGLDIMAAGLFVLLVLWFEQQSRPRIVATSLRLLQNRRSHLFLLSCVRSPLPVLPLRILHQYIRLGSRPGTRTVESRSAGKLPLVHALSRRLFRRTLPAGKIHLSLRSPSRAGHCPPGVAVEAPATGSARLWVTCLLLLLAYISFYARYTFWSGDFAWGDRYVSTTVELAALIAVPLLLRYREHLGKTIWRAGMPADRSQPGDSVRIACLLAAAGNLPDGDARPSDVRDRSALQEYRRLRSGQDGCLGLEHRAMGWDPWDYVHINTWNFLPFLLRRVGAAPAWVVDTAFAVWFAGIAALGAVLLRLRSSLRMVA